MSLSFVERLLVTKERDLLCLQESQEEEEEEERGEPEGKGRGNEESHLSSPSPESRPDNVVKVSTPSIPPTFLPPLSIHLSIYLSICHLIHVILFNLFLGLDCFLFFFLFGGAEGKGWTREPKAALISSYCWSDLCRKCYSHDQTDNISFTKWKTGQL